MMNDTNTTSVAPSEPDVTEGPAAPVEQNPVPIEAPQPPGLLQRVLEENQGLRTVLGTLLQRSNGTLVLLRKDRSRYFDTLNSAPPHDPNIILENVRGIRRGPGGVKESYNTGDLKVSLRWVRRPEQKGILPEPKPAPAEPSGPPASEVAELLESVSVKLELPVIETWTSEQRIQALQWAAARRVHDQGIEIEVPPRPSFLPEPSLIITP